MGGEQPRPLPVLRGQGLCLGHLPIPGAQHAALDIRGSWQVSEMDEWQVDGWVEWVGKGING